MKDSQLFSAPASGETKYIKANNERFSTVVGSGARVDKYIKANNERFSTSKTSKVAAGISISRRIMKDSQRSCLCWRLRGKYIKANNERFSTARRHPASVV